MGPYEVVRRLGAGGMGVVYLAHAPGGDLVAVKVMNSDWVAQAGFRIRFEREVEAIRLVAPFCTAPVLDAATDGDLAYIVTEYVEGDTLWQSVRGRGPLAGARLESVAVGTAVALTAIHRAGVVHRDLKPGNVILSPEGPKVIDFGVARLAGSIPITGDFAIGTPPFMSPEQARGEVVTHASDVFSWGAVVAFASTGRAPFGATSGPDVFYRIVHERPDLTGLPDRLALVVQRAMAKDARQRPTARDLIDVLVGRSVDELVELPVTSADGEPVSAEDRPAPPRLSLVVSAPPNGAPEVPAAEPGTDTGTEPQARSQRGGTQNGLRSGGTRSGLRRGGEQPGGTRPGGERRRRRWQTGLAAGVVGLCALGGGAAYAMLGQKAAPPPSTFDDDFDTERGWLERDQADGIARYHDGGYLLQLPAGRGMATTAPVRADDMGDVRVTARARMQGGTGSYGIWCGGNPVTQATNRYDFFVTSEGNAGIVKEFQNGVRQELRPFQKTPGITGGENRIEAECRFGDGVTRLRMRVNGRLAATYDDRTRPHGAGAGGTAAIAGNAAMTVRYESFSVQRLR
ncbi:serine/threonine-protein kinase [Spirillospora sp. NPDC047279]|uniref:serine/threonine protein kinase n=1 Tax=Spirillospora sp. NPDC047279 TaxID=3155478 RepID=UPI0033C79B7D